MVDKRTRIRLVEVITNDRDAFFRGTHPEVAALLDGDIARGRGLSEQTAQVFVGGALNLVMRVVHGTDLKREIEAE